MKSALSGELSFCVKGKVGENLTKEMAEKFLSCSQGQIISERISVGGTTKPSLPAKTPRAYGSP